MNDMPNMSAPADALLPGGLSMPEDFVEYTPPPETDEQAFTRLAALSPADYDRCRDAEAQKLGIRIPTLDEEVRKARGGGEETHGRIVTPKLPEPWEQPVEIGSLLDDLTKAIARHMVLSAAARDAVALWCAHTWVYQRFDHTPRLSITSPEKRCGKSTLLDILETVSRSPVPAGSISAAAMYRTIEALAPCTLLIDEVDTFLADNEELRGVLNNGYNRGKPVIRLMSIKDEWQPVEFDVFAPVALAGIGKLPETVADRAVPIRLERKTATQTIARLRAPGARPKLNEMARKLLRWALDERGNLNQDPDMPHEMGDREADICVPLVSIADAAGPEWAERGRRALLTLFRGRAQDEESSGNGAMLLADIRAIFKEKGSHRITSANLAALLGEMEERPWSEWRQGKPITAPQLARLLRPFGVRPSNQRQADGTVVKGYQRDHFETAWNRYCPDENPETIETGKANRYHATSQENAGGFVKTEPLPAPKVADYEFSKDDDIISKVAEKPLGSGLNTPDMEKGAYTPSDNPADDLDEVEL